MNQPTNFLSTASTVADTKDMLTFPQQCNSCNIMDVWDMWEDRLGTNTYAQMHRSTSGKSLKSKEKQEEI